MGSQTARPDLTPRRPPRVAVLALASRFYGSDSYFRAFLPALARFGGDVEFVVLAYDDRYRALCPDDGPVRLHRCAAPAVPTGPFRLLWEQIMLPRVLSGLDVDVVYTATNVAVLRWSGPSVITIRNMEPLVPACPGTPGALRVRHRLLNRLTLASMRRARRIIAVSGFVRETLLALGAPADKIDVVYHGVDDLVPPAEGADTRKGGYVAFAGKFIRYANLETLFRAFARMSELGYKGELRFAGGPWDAGYERSMRALVGSLGIAERVHFLGYVARADVQAMMRDSDVFLFSSTLEACPFTLLEAMRQEVPIVATTAPPMREFCGDAALYVEPTDGDAFGEAAYRVATDPDLRERLRRAARARAGRFRWEDSVRRLVDSLVKASQGTEAGG